MSDRNWEAELAKIDKQLASVSDEQLLQQSAQPAPARGPLAAPNVGKAAAAKSTPASVAPTRTTRSWIAWVQLTVAIAAGVGLWFWPWATRCGLNAIAFTAATGGVTLLGLWSAVGSWRHRQGAAHVLSFAVMIWGLVLGAREVLPRMGYAIPTVERPSGWSCEALPLPSPKTLPETPSGSPTQPQPATQPVLPPDAQSSSRQPAAAQPVAGQQLRFSQLPASQPLVSR